MKLDRKLLLIAPAIVLAFVAAGIVYTAYELRYLVNASASWQERTDFVNAVARGEKPLTADQAIRMLQYSLDAEAKRTTAINATRDLLVELAAIAFLSCAVLALGIRSVPREHWPRFQLSRAPDG